MEEKLTNSMQQSVPLEADSFLARQETPNDCAPSDEMFDVV
jgi:hypothetical protein